MPQGPFTKSGNLRLDLGSETLLRGAAFRKMLANQSVYNANAGFDMQGNPVDITTGLAVDASLVHPNARIKTTLQSDGRTQSSSIIVPQGLGLKAGNVSFTTPYVATSSNCCPPATFDLRYDVPLSAQYPDCHDQGWMGSCTAFAGGFASTWPRILQGTPDASDSTAESFLWYWTKMLDNGGSFNSQTNASGTPIYVGDWGCNFDDVIKLLTTVGAPLEDDSDCPYDINSGTASLPQNPSGLAGNNAYPGPLDPSGLEARAAEERNICSAPVMVDQSSTDFGLRVLALQNAIYNAGKRLRCFWCH